MSSLLGKVLYEALHTSRMWGPADQQEAHTAGACHSFGGYAEVAS